MEEFTRVAQALSDETRLRIINLLFFSQCCVCEVMQALLITQTRASRNLKILYDAGFLKQRCDGLYTMYSIKDLKDGDFRLQMLGAVKKMSQGIRLMEDDLARLRKAERVGFGCANKSKMEPGYAR